MGWAMLSLNVSPNANGCIQDVKTMENRKTVTRDVVAVA